MATVSRCVVAGMQHFQLGNSVCSDQTDVNGDAASLAFGAQLKENFHLFQ